MRWLLLGALMFLVGAIIASQNQGNVTVEFLFWNWTDIPLVYVIGVSAAIGVLGTGSLWMWSKIKSSMKVWELQGKIRRLESERDALQKKVEEMEKKLEEMDKTGTEVETGN